MSTPKRTYEVRLLITVIANLDHRELTDRIAGARQPGFVTDLVTDDVTSHLMTLAYVTKASVTRL